MVSWIQRWMRVTAVRSGRGQCPRNSQRTVLKAMRMILLVMLVRCRWPPTVPCYRCCWDVRTLHATVMSEHGNCLLDFVAQWWGRQYLMGFCSSDGCVRSLVLIVVNYRLSSARRCDFYATGTFRRRKDTFFQRVCSRASTTSFLLRFNRYRVGL